MFAAVAEIRQSGRRWKNSAQVWAVAPFVESPPSLKALWRTVSTPLHSVCIREAKSDLKRSNVGSADRI